MVKILNMGQNNLKLFATFLEFFHYKALCRLVSSVGKVASLFGMQRNEDEVYVTLFSLVGISILCSDQ